jgi:hypothetical protein
MISSLVLVSTIGGFLVAAAPALAQGVQSQFFDPSIEGAGMGGASIAAFWEENPNDRANPALMGFHRGLRYSYGDTQLVPELADDVHFSSHRILAGAWGVGVAMTGKPIESVGRLRIDYGELEVTDAFGNPITLEPHEDVRSFAVGVSVLDLVSSIRVARGGEPLELSRRVSLALGHAWKTYKIDFAPVELIPNGQGEGSNNDAGLVLRIAPYDGIGGGLMESSDHLRFRLELAGAMSRLNYLNDRSVEYANGDSDDLQSERNAGASAQVTMAVPGDLGWFSNIATPAIRMGFAWEESNLYQDDEKLSYYATRVGGVVSFFDVLYFRSGHLRDYISTQNGNTIGLGLSLKWKNAFGVKGDYATQPRGEFLPSDRDRWGFTVFVDPYRLMKLQKE